MTGSWPVLYLFMPSCMLALALSHLTWASKIVTAILSKTKLQFIPKFKYIWCTSVVVVLDDYSMSTYFWDFLQPRNCELYLITAILPMCTICHIESAAYENTCVTNTTSVLNNLSIFIDLDDHRSVNWDAAARQWSCWWAGQLLMLLGGWRHSKLLYFPIRIPEMTVNGKHGIRVAAFLSCFLSSSFKRIRIE